MKTAVVISSTEVIYHREGVGDVLAQRVDQALMRGLDVRVSFHGNDQMTLPPDLLVRSFTERSRG